MSYGDISPAKKSRKISKASFGEYVEQIYTEEENEEMEEKKG